MIISLSPVHAADIVTGLVAHWKLDGNAGDYSGRGNNGTIVGATATPDRFGFANAALSFNGTSNKVTVPSSASLQALDANANSYSFSVWVKATSPGAHRIIERISGSCYSISFQGQNTNSTAGIWDGTDSSFVSFGNIWNGNWRHLVFVVDYSTDKLYGYLDGAPLTPVTNALTSTTAGVAVLYIGGNGNNSRDFNGTIDDVRIYNRALTADDAAALYRNGGPTRFRNGVFRGGVIR